MVDQESPDDQVPLFTDGGVTWTISRRSAEIGRAVADAQIRYNQWASRQNAARIAAARPWLHTLPFFWLGAEAERA